MNDVNRDALKNVTVGGVPVLDYIEVRKRKKTNQEVRILIDQEKTKKHHYHCLKPKLRVKKERNGPVMITKKAEIHHKNREAYLKQSKGDIRKMVVALLLSSKGETNLVKMYAGLEDILPIGELPRTGQVRSHMNFVKKSNLGKFIITDRKKPEEGDFPIVHYELLEEAKETFDFKEACELAYDLSEWKEQKTLENGSEEDGKDQDPSFSPAKDTCSEAAEIDSDGGEEAGPSIRLTLKDDKGVPTLRLEGHFHFYFHFGGK